MNDDYLNQIAKTVIKLDKKKSFDKAKVAVENIKDIIRKIEVTYQTSASTDLKKQLLDLTYKQYELFEFIFLLSKDFEEKELFLDTKINKNVFEIHFASADKIVIKTPFPPLKIGEYRTNISKLYADFLRNKLESFFKENNLSFPLFKKATVNFILYINSNCTTGPIPDADNLDLKRILDSLQMFIIPDDNLLTIDYTISGQNTPDEPRMEIIITNKN